MAYAATTGTNYEGPGNDNVKFDLDAQQVVLQHHGLPMNHQQQQQPQVYQYNPQQQQHHPQLQPHQQQYPTNGNTHHEDLLQQQQNGMQNGLHSGMQTPMQQNGPQNGIQNGMSNNGNQNGTNTGSDGSGKGNRLRKACDSCSIRKVKCDESGPPCRACAALDIPCTFERPSRRRGPPNRHAEAIKKRRLESPGGAFAPISPNNVALTLASLSQPPLNAESICPFSTLELLIDDFFTYIHPLCPFPHEPSFRAAFKQREDMNNTSFLALLASMVGALVASFPRKPRLHLKAQHRETLFPNSLSLVDRCHKVAVEARGLGYLDKELTVYDAATSYFLGLAGAYTINWKQCRIYFSETLTIIRAIGAHKLKDPSFYSVGQLPTVMGSDRPPYEGVQGEPVDYIRQEIGRRIFWVIFVGVRSMQQLGVSFGELVICPPTPTEPYPPLPLEVDDQYIYVDHVDPQPAGVISELVGFNLGVSIYMTITPVATMEMAYGIDEVFDWNRQRRILEECLRSVKKTLDNAPRELILLPSSQNGEFEPMKERSYYPPAQDLPGVRGMGGDIRQGGFESHSPDERRWIKYEIQKANIYASQLGTRSYIVEKFWNLLDANSQVKNRSNSSSSQSSPNSMTLPLDSMLPKNSGNNATNDTNGKNSQGAYDMIEIQMSSERENIVKDLLKVLASISQVNMEPNGGSFINKIRQIASTLLDTPRNRKGPLAIKAEDYLARFLDVLMKLEWISPNSPSSQDPRDPNGSAGISKEDEDEEQLRHWADLREYQTRFAQSGGFLDF